VSAPLLAAFGAAGGAPPATVESLRVLADGRARALVGSAWPAGTPQDEAGLYETTLAPGELEAVRALAADDALRAAAGEHGPIHPDSGRSSLRLGEDVRIRWGANAEPPEPVLAAAARMRRLLATVREHPVAVLRLGLRVETEGLAFELSNPGREPVRHSVVLPGTEPPRVAVLAPGDADGPLPLSTYRAAVAVTAERCEDELAAGATRTVPATARLELAPGEHDLVAFARGALEVRVDGRPVPLDVFLISRPVRARG
jgi:hypothetical protein